MKKISKIIFVASIALAAISCNKPAPEKAAVESSFDACAPVPTASIDAQSFSTDGLTATVKVSFSGVTEAAQDGLSLGLVYSTDPTFSQSSFIPADKLEDGTYTMTCNVVAKSKTYFKAAAANKGGSSYSETLAMDIPDIPFYLKISGTYFVKETSEADGHEYEHDIEIAVDKNDNTKCIIKNIEPYYASNGLLFNKGYNYLEGIVDNDAETITVPALTSLNLGGRMVCGLGDEGLLDIVFKFDGTNALIRDISMYIVYINENNGLSAEDAYAPTTYTKK